MNCSRCRRSQPESTDRVEHAQLQNAPIAHGRLYRWLVSVPAVLIKVPDAIANTWQVTKTVIAGEPDLLGAFKQSCRRTITLFPFTTANGTTNHVVVDPKVMKAVLAPFRNEEEGTYSDFENAKVFNPVLRALFCDASIPDKVIAESFVFTAKAEGANRYHMSIVSHLGKLPTEERLARLAPLVQETIDQWVADGVPDARGAARNFATRAILRIFFDITDVPVTATERLHKALDCIVERMTNSIVKKPPSEIEAADYARALETMRSGVEMILRLGFSSPNSILQAMDEYSLLQKQSLVFILLFAGVDTTGTLVNYLLWRLGKEKSLQEGFHARPLQDQNDYVRGLIKEGIRLHPPAPIIGRYPHQPLAIETLCASGKKSSYVVRPPEGLLCAPEFAALSQDFFPNPTLFDPMRHQGDDAAFSAIPFFGAGRHRCPGESLAMQEITQLLFCILQRHTIETKGPDVLKSSSLIIRKTTSAQVQLVPR